MDSKTSPIQVGLRPTGFLLQEVLQPLDYGARAGLELPEVGQQAVQRVENLCKEATECEGNHPHAVEEAD